MQSGVLIVALLFFSAKLSSFPRVERNEQRSKTVQNILEINFHEKNKFHAKQNSIFGEKRDR